MDIQAMLFDMDGLLIDTEDLHLRASSETARQLGFERRPEAFVEWIGLPTSQWAEWMLTQCETDATPEEVIAMEHAAFLRVLRDERPPPLPGVREMIGVCDGLRLKRGLVSSTRFDQLSQIMDVVLSHLGRPSRLEETFHALVTGDDVQREKPAPDPYLQVAERLAVPPVACLAFEDSPAGVASARAAGCRTVAVPNIYLDGEEVGREAHVSFPSLLEAFRARVWETG
jgi:beta-phosphoglucomutase-like phosphatase (HAD superfamily)